MMGSSQLLADDRAGIPRTGGFSAITLYHPPGGMPWDHDRRMHDGLTPFKLKAGIHAIAYIARPCKKCMARIRSPASRDDVEIPRAAWKSSRR
jgi:hypothetical protein